MFPLFVIFLFSFGTDGYGKEMAVISTYKFFETILDGSDHLPLSAFMS